MAGNMVPMSGGGSNADGNTQNRGGQGLPQSLQHQFETTLGQSLADVRVHTQHNQQATLLALGAQAFTQGSDIYFGAGEYQPFSESGQKLIGHELAHIVQQGGETALEVPEGMAQATSEAGSDE